MDNKRSFNKDIIPADIASYGTWRHVIMIPFVFNKNVSIGDSKFGKHARGNINNSIMCRDNSHINTPVKPKIDNFYANKREQNFKNNLSGGSCVKRENCDKKVMNSKEIGKRLNSDVDRDLIMRREYDVEQNLDKQKLDTYNQRYRQITEKQRNRKNKRLADEFGKGYIFSRQNLM